jgi:hypothetical protein
MTQIEILTENVSEAIDPLNSAAQKLQAHYLSEHGVQYELNDLKQVLTNWLGMEITALAEDAFFHVVEGAEPFVQGRRNFNGLIARVNPSPALSQAA